MTVGHQKDYGPDSSPSPLGNYILLTLMLGPLSIPVVQLQIPPHSYTNRDRPVPSQDLPALVVVGLMPHIILKRPPDTYLVVMGSMIKDHHVLTCQICYVPKALSPADACPCCEL